MLKTKHWATTRKNSSHLHCEDEILRKLSKVETRHWLVQTQRTYSAFMFLISVKHDYIDKFEMIFLVSNFFLLHFVLLVHQLFWTTVCPSQKTNIKNFTSSGSNSEGPEVDGSRDVTGSWDFRVGIHLGVMDPFTSGLWKFDRTLCWSSMGERWRERWTAHGTNSRFESDWDRSSGEFLDVLLFILGGFWGVFFLWYIISIMPWFDVNICCCRKNSVDMWAFFVKDNQTSHGFW